MARILMPFLLFSFWGSNEAPKTGTVVFEIRNIDPKLGGNISAGIFQKEFFPQVGKQFQGKDLKVSGRSMTITIKEVPPGTYGAVAFQDANENQELDANFLGFPTEPIGFANGAQINFGPPSFEDASIRVEEGKVSRIVIKLN